MDKLSVDIQIELLQSSWLEHQKAAKDMAFIYGIDDPKRKRIEAELNSIVNQIKLLR